MAREEFLQNVRLAVRHITPAAENDGGDPKADWTARLQLASAWLSPKSVEGFRPDDFRDLPPEQQSELQEAVSQFLAVALRAPGSGPASDEQITAALQPFRRIVMIVQRVVREEWIKAVDTFLQEMEAWSGRRGWSVLREPKKLAEKFLGPYEVPQLLIHTTAGRVLATPVARYISSGSGLVDLCVLPSFDSVAVTRKNGHWYLHPSRTPDANTPWNETTFADTVTELLKRA